VEEHLTIEQKRAMSAMGGDRPYKRFKKAIMGKVAVLFLDPIRFTPETLILAGDPSNPKIDPADLSIELWTKAEYQYFLRKNKALIEKGVLVEVETEEELLIETVNQISDEEIDEILGKPFMALKHRLVRFTSPVPVRRILVRALELDKSIGFVDHIKAKLAELEGFEAPPRMPERMEVKL